MPFNGLPLEIQPATEGECSLGAGQYINDAAGEPYAFAQSPDRAALIVRAVNSHAALVDALRGLLNERSVRIMEEAAREYPHGKEDVAGVLAAFDAARAAIKLAEES